MHLNGCSNLLNRSPRRLALHNPLRVRAGKLFILVTRKDYAPIGLPKACLREKEREKRGERQKHLASPSPSHLCTSPTIKGYWFEGLYFLSSSYWKMANFTNPTRPFNNGKLGRTAYQQGLNFQTPRPKIQASVSTARSQ